MLSALTATCCAITRHRATPSVSMY
jgi:hypothetical protein